MHQGRCIRSKRDPFVLYIVKRDTVYREQALSRMRPEPAVSRGFSPSCKTGCQKSTWPASIADVMNELDLSAVYSVYERRDGRGQSAYHPLAMARLLPYGYCIGVTSFRKIEDATYNDLAFRYLAANQHPDHRHDRDVSPATSRSAGWPVRAGVAVVREGWLGEVRQRRN